MSIRTAALGVLFAFLPLYAFAHDASELTALQVWAGYLSWMGLFKILGATLMAGGLIFITRGIIIPLVFHSRVLIEIVGYIVSAGLIAGGTWVSPEYLTWTVFIGCLLFMGTVFLTLWIHKIEGDDPKTLAALFMVVWGAVAIYYNMPEVGFLSVMALMHLIGFSVIVSPLCYAFGFEKKNVMASATATALMLLGAFVLLKLVAQDTPAFIAVFETGAFWLGSFVGFTGLLIMSCGFYKKNPGQYVWMQICTVAMYLVGIFLGMTFGINALAGIAGTFFALYLMEKPWDVKRSGMTGFGIVLLCSGGITFGIWSLAVKYESIIQQYLTTSL